MTGVSTSDRRVRFLWSAAGVAALAALAVGCGSSDRVVLNTERVERSVEGSISAQRHLHATVSCPDNVEQRKGVRFTCSATVGGRRYPVAVRETDGAGHVVYVVR